MKNLILIFTIHLTFLFAQNSILGSLVDDGSNNSLSYSITVQLKGDTNYVVASDSLGFFIFKDIKLGTYTLDIDDDFFERYTTSVLLESGNQLKMLIKLKERVHKLADVVIESPYYNPYKVTSNYNFSAGDFRKTSATLGDPGRIVQILPGVIPSSNGSNGISIRGNNPYNNNWYLDDIEIPNPNHFGGFGATSGFLGIFNESNLSGFDFYTGGYPAMYANSNAGIFDLRMKKGNKLKRESFAKVNFLGISAGTEGYFKKGKQATYLLTGRIFDTRVVNLTKMLEGKDLIIPRFQDYSYKINLPINKKLDLSFFGFGASNNLQSIYSVYNETTNNQVLCNNFSTTYSINTNSQLKAIVQLSNTRFDYSYLVRKTSGYEKTQKEDIIRSNIYFQHKFNAKLRIRIGYQGAFTGYKYKRTSLPLSNFDRDSARDNYDIGYLNLNWRLTSKSLLTLGINNLYTKLLKRYSLEPKASITTQVSNGYKLSFSTGIYSKVPIAYGFENIKNTPKLMKTGQFIVSNEFQLDSGFTFKVEAYYQYYWNVYYINSIVNGVKNETVLNNPILEYSPNPINSNTTTGRNFGIEVFMNKSFKRNYHLVFSGSLFDSRFKNSEGKLLNTIFNNRFNFVASLDKEYLRKKSYGIKVVNISCKTLYYGGYYAIPISLTTSQIYQDTYYDIRGIYSDKLPNNFRIDLGIQISYSRKRVKHELRFDIQNVSNHKNVVKRYYDPITDQVKATYQFPILPIIGYGIYF